jgi:dihydrofolate synthase/folylpolyglutamate synthase
MQFADRDAALAFLFARINYERKTDAPYRETVYKLDRMRELLAALGDPHLRKPVVHVAGTKGKGSTATMIASVLSAAGYRVGLYTSPHMQALEERIAVDGKPCTADELVSLAGRAAAVVEELDKRADDSGDETQRPTYFEITTAMAWLHFVDRDVDLAVLEVGLGGRLDSTNLCRPIVSVITSISLDHIKQLGGTLAAIAAEKVGIIKPGIPVVSGVTEAEPAEVILSRAGQTGSPLWRLGHEFAYVYHASEREGSPGSFDFSGRLFGERQTLRELTVGMLGRRQAQNGAVAVATIGTLHDAGWRIDEPSLREGLASARCPARIEMVASAPAVVIDAAHNVASVEALIEALEEHFAGRPKRLIFASSSDKDAAGMLALLAPHFERIVLTEFNSPRSMAAGDLLEIAGGARAELHAAPNIESAWRTAAASVSREHVVCVTGSFFIAAEMRSFWAAQRRA